MTSDSVKDWIDSFQDRDGRARAMLEACAVDENDPDMVRLAAHAATGDSYHSQVMAALLKPVKKRRGRNKAERRLHRMRNHHPALAGLGWKPVKEGPVEKQYGGSPGPKRASIRSRKSRRRKLSWRSIRVSRPTFTRTTKRCGRICRT